jgi:hypothetical protein
LQTKGRLSARHTKPYSREPAISLWGRGKEGYMSKREKLIKKIETLSENRLVEVDRFVDGLNNGFYPDYSPEQMQEAYDNLQKIVSELPPIEVDLKKAKADYFEEKYGRFD